MFAKYKYKNWKQNHPSTIMEYCFSPCSLGLRWVNFVFQKVFRINAEVPFMVHFTSSVSKTIFIGKNVARYFANSGGCYIQGINNIHIGDNTIFAPGIKIISANHHKNDYQKHDRSVAPVRIGNNCWIGANAVILPGVILGDNVIVGAGSVVTKSFSSNLTIGGNPARILKSE